jgi:hypothetical protein
MKKYIRAPSPSPEFNPRCLVDAAVLIDRARQEGEKGFLEQAVDHNRQLWAHIHSLSALPNNPFPKESHSELNRLSDYVWAATKSKGSDISDMVLDTLINIDLQVSEGLLYKNRH